MDVGHWTLDAEGWKPQEKHVAHPASALQHPADFAIALAEKLSRLPTDGGDLTRVPAAITGALTRVGRYKWTMPTRATVNRLEYEYLAALALSGWSLRLALTEAVNHGKNLQERSGSFKAAWRHLTEAGLWQAVQVRVASYRAVLVRLTEAGRDLLAKAGITAVVSEWELIEARHSGGSERQLSHTARICVFLYHARRFGYATEPCPTLDLKGSPSFAQPDAIIRTPSGEVLPEAWGLPGRNELYVEVQGRGGAMWRRVEKWRNLHNLQGGVAVCAENPHMAGRLAYEAQFIGVPTGVFTDLQSLISGTATELWTHRWTNPYRMPEPMVRRQ